jgi:hypothetical protein
VGAAWLAPAAPAATAATAATAAHAAVQEGGEACLGWGEG